MKRLMNARLLFFPIVVFAWGTLPLAAEPPPIGITLIPHGTTFKSFADYEQTINFDPLWNRQDRPKITSAELEIRFPGEKLRVIRYPYFWLLNAPLPLDDERLLRLPNTVSYKLGDPALRRMGETKPGEYQLALYLNGVRASNVVSIQIDPQYNPERVPVLALQGIEHNPCETRGRLVIRIQQPPLFDPDLTVLAIYSTPLIVDGKKENTSFVSWSGPKGLVAKGGSEWFIRDLSDFYIIGEPRHFDPDKPHILGLEYGKYAAAPLYFDPMANKLGQAWDADTPKIKDAPHSSHPQLAGRLVDDKGKAFPSCEIDLTPTDGGTSYIEYTDQNGSYQFAGVPPGTYVVRCKNLQCVSATISVKETAVTLTDVKTEHMNLKAEHSWP